MECFGAPVVFGGAPASWTRVMFDVVVVGVGGGIAVSSLCGVCVRAPLRRGHRRSWRAGWGRRSSSWVRLGSRRRIVERLGCIEPPKREKVDQKIFPKKIFAFVVDTFIYIYHSVLLQNFAPKMNVKRFLYCFLFFLIQFIIVVLRFMFILCFVMHFLFVLSVNLKTFLIIY